MKHHRPGRVRFLHAIEHALLREWLAQFDIRASEDVVPPVGELGLVDWRATLDFAEDEWDEARLGVRPRASSTGDLGCALSNAIARLCLESVYDETPSAIRTRCKSSVRRVTHRAARMRSSHLLSIDWTDDARSTHHFVSYYWTWVPYYECSVISASSFTPDPQAGHHDLARYAFDPSIDLLEGARRALLLEWARFEPRRAQFMDFGLIDGPLARAWAERARTR